MQVDWLLCVSSCTRTCERVCACVHIAVGRYACSWGSTALESGKTQIHIHTHRDTPLSQAEEVCSGHSSPKCFSHGYQTGLGVVGWGALNLGPASAPHLLCLQRHHFGLGSRKWGRGTSLEEADLTVAHLILSLPAPKILGHIMIGDPFGRQTRVPFFCF